MRRALTILTAVITIASCRKAEKTSNVTCNDPAVTVARGNSLTQADWDTVITREYLKGFKSPIISDTFYTKPGDLLLITQSRNLPKDFEIVLTSINKTYRLTDLVITERKEQQKSNSIATCYNNVSYSLDGNATTAVTSKQVIIPLEK